MYYIFFKIMNSKLLLINTGFIILKEHINIIKCASHNKGKEIELQGLIKQLTH